MTPHHLAIAMEYAPGGDLSEYVDACKRAGVRFLPPNAHLPCVACMSDLCNRTSSSVYG